MNITYETFLSLYKEAKEYDDVDLYVAERGWQPWMDDIGGVDEAVKLMYKIYDLRFANVKELRAELGYTLNKYAQLFNTSQRNVERWESGERNIAPAWLSLMVYAVIGIKWKENEQTYNERNH